MRTCIASLLALAALAPAREAQQPPRPLINGGLPSVSPDGRHVAFISARAGAPDVYVIGADGGGLVQLSNTPEPETAPTWSADGRVLFSKLAMDSSNVVSVAPTGGEARLIGRVAARSPVLSRDGKRFLYSAGAFPALRLTVASVDGSGARAISEPGIIFNAVWSPDESQIAFARGDSVTRQLQVWVMNADGTGARQLTKFAQAEGSPQWPAWSPDGRRLAIQAGKYNRDRPGENTAHIWVLDVATGAATKLAAHEKPYLDETPSWFPDGRRIAFQSDRTGKMELWVMNADGSGARQLTR